MAVTREQFAAGQTYQAFKDQMTRNREQVEQNERSVPLSAADIQALRGLPQPVNVLAIAEDWCADVVANLPVLGRLAEESGKLNVRVLPRDVGPGSDAMDQHLKDGQFRSIPVFVFLDQDFNERGVLIERPDSVTELREQKTREIYQQHPELGSPDQPVGDLPEDVRVKVQAAIRAMRQETNTFYLSESARQIMDMVQRATAGAGAA